MNYLPLFLDRTSMYRTVLYSLGVAVIYSLIISVFGFLGGSFLEYGLSFVLISLVTLLTHYILVYITQAPGNVEASLITAGILFFIVAPPKTTTEAIGIALVSVMAILFKYCIVYKKKHIFNPSGIALVVAGSLALIYPTWWVASLSMFPVIILISYIILKKTRRFELFFLYIGVTTLIATGGALFQGTPLVSTLSTHILSWPIIFLGAVMLTEPSTLPPTRLLQYLYAVIVGLLTMIPFHVGVFYNTPELALVIGNVFSYLVSTKGKVLLTFKEKTLIAHDTYEFTFLKDRNFNFLAGQYMEWSLPHKNADNRGIRRHFTIASSPLEETVSLGVKMAPATMIGSSFKKALMSLQQGDVLYGSSTAGDFVLPRDVTSPLVFIAGGIGITPFISMLRYMMSTQEKRKVVVFYCNKTPQDIAYRDFLDQASTNLDIKIVHVVSDVGENPSPLFEQGYVTQELLTKYLGDSKNNIFYISGPPGMVSSYTALIKMSGVSTRSVHTDYFPGFL